MSPFTPSIGRSGTTKPKPRGLVWMRPTMRFMRSGRPKRLPRVSTRWPDSTSALSKPVIVGRCSRGIFRRCISSRGVAGCSTFSRIRFSSCSRLVIVFILLFPTVVPPQPSTDRVTLRQGSEDALPVAPGQALRPGSGQALGQGSGPAGTETANPDDVTLVRRAQAGDVDAFGELVERHRRAVFRAALAAVRSPADADEVAQEAFVTAFQKLDGFRGEASFKTWLLAITWRRGIDRRRSVTKWMQRLVSPGRAGDEGEEWDPMERLTAGGQTQEEDAMTSDLRRRLKPLIAGLPKKLRDALLLAGSGDHSYPEIAQMLGIPLGTLKWRVSEARKVLKAKMVALGYDDVC